MSSYLQSVHLASVFLTGNCQLGVQYSGSISQSYSLFTVANEWTFLSPLLIDSNHLQLTTYEITLSFKTTNPDGIIIFSEHISGSDPSQVKDFLGLYMKDGKLTHKFDNYISPIQATTPNAYNDGLWHNVTITKNGDVCEICVGADCVRNIGKTSGGTASVLPQISIGGVSSTLCTQAMTNLVSREPTSLLLVQKYYTKGY